MMKKRKMRKKKINIGRMEINKRSNEKKIRLTIGPKKVRKDFAEKEMTC